MRCCRPALQEPDGAMGDRQAAAVLVVVEVVVRCKRTKENGRRMNVSRVVVVKRR